MIKNMFINLTNHPSSAWSAKQIEATKSTKIIDMGFPNVDPNCDNKDIAKIAKEVVRDVIGTIEANDGDMNTAHVLVQGEMSLTYAIVTLLQRDHHVACGVACSERKTVETVLPDGSTKKTAVFEFVRFRRYPRWIDLI